VARRQPEEFSQQASFGRALWTRLQGDGSCHRYALAARPKSKVHTIDGGNHIIVKRLSFKAPDKGEIWHFDIESDASMYPCKIQRTRLVCPELHPVNRNDRTFDIADAFRNARELALHINSVDGYTVPGGVPFPYGWPVVWEEGNSFGFLARDDWLVAADAPDPPFHSIVLPREAAIAYYAQVWDCLFHLGTVPDKSEINKTFEKREGRAGEIGIPSLSFENLRLKGCLRDEGVPPPVGTLLTLKPWSREKVAIPPGNRCLAECDKVLPWPGGRKEQLRGRQVDPRYRGGLRSYWEGPCCFMPSLPPRLRGE